MLLQIVFTNINLWGVNMNEETTLEVGEDVSGVSENETVEIVGVSEQSFNRNMGSISHLLEIQIVGLALIFGALVAISFMRWFNVR